jgi:heme oxygenase (biliverdin-IX-beta and delta-forming)
MKPNAGFDPKAACKKLMREARSGALATLMPSSGDPYCSLVNVATAADGAPLLLLSKLALHTRNILADSRVSLMFDEGRSDDPLEGARIMLMGNAAVTGDVNARRRYLVRHPQADMFAGFGDFAFYRVTPKVAHLVAGFGRIVDLAASDIVTDLSGAQALVLAEAEIVTHINDDHADTARLYATKLLGGPDGAWRCVGCDPEGLELQLDHIALRLAFPQRIKSPGKLREILQELAQTARSA